MPNILFLAEDPLWDEYRDPLNKAFQAAGFDGDLRTDHSPLAVDYIVYGPKRGQGDDFRPYINVKAVMSLWAGVETIVDNPTLTKPLIRMVDDGLTNGMVEWVTGHTLRHHLGMDTHIHQQDGEWRNTTYPPLASQRPVTILGIGALGAACGQALHALGFPVTGWSRGAKHIPNIRCMHGDDGLQAALKDAQIVILLLPQTPETENILTAKTLSLLANGAFVINPGRGPLIDDEALLLALKTGQVAHATLDVFRTEPLPQDHPFWSHPQITVTPHIASTTRPDTAAGVITANIKRGESGLPFANVVDRGAGY